MLWWLHVRARYHHTAWTTSKGSKDAIVLFGGTDDHLVGPKCNQTEKALCEKSEPSEFTAEIVPGQNIIVLSFSFLTSDGGFFDLAHNGYLTCGIPDGDSFVLTGGLLHNFVTRSKNGVSSQQFAGFMEQKELLPQDLLPFVGKDF